MNLRLPGYEILERIYISRRSRIYRAQTIEDKTRVIVKASAETFPPARELQRLQHEYEMGSRFNDAHILRYLKLLPYEGGHVLITEDFSAVGLSEILPDRGLELGPFLELAIQLAESMDIIHDQGIIHRDINPRNLVIHRKTGQVKVIDFGISSNIYQTPRPMREAGGPEGTLDYMAPEQTGRLDRPVDYRADFYALGASFHHLLTGSCLFPGKDPLELIHCHLAMLPKAPHEIVNRIPNVISDIISKLLEKNPDRRYQSGGALKQDLEQCLSDLESKGRIESFPLEHERGRGQFKMLRELYGRDRELRELVHFCERIGHGARGFMLVTGEAGMGKTALLKKLSTRLAGRGYFARGEAQALDAQDFFPVIEAVRDLMRQILSETEGSIQNWKNELGDQLGAGGRDLLEAVPELSWFLDTEPELPDTGIREKRNRFAMVFKKLVAVFAKRKHPLVLFLDNLQWIDSASLELIFSILQDPGIEALAIIGTCRHPIPEELACFMEELAPQLEGTSLHLEPLTPKAVTALIAETFQCSLSRASTLAKVVHQKTGGNPSFSYDFLHYLHEENHISFSYQKGRWQWALSKIARLKISDDVAHYLIGKLQKLPPNMRDLLISASCIGNRFHVDVLAYACQQDRATVLTLLEEVIHRGLIATSEYMPSPLLRKSSLPPDFKGFRFRHERLCDAANQLVPKQNLAPIHHRIARFYWQKQGESRALVSEVLKYFQLAGDELLVGEERNAVARLGLEAAKKAKKASAHVLAHRYLSFCWRLLPKNSWQDHYGFTLEIAMELLECQFLIGRMVEGEALARIILERAKTPLDRARVYLILLIYRSVAGLHNEALEAGFSGLALLGLRLKPKVTSLQILLQVLTIKWRIKNRKIEELITDSTRPDAEQRMIMRLLMVMSAPAFLTGRKKLYALLAAKRVNDSLVRGNSPESGSAYVSFGSLLNSELGRFRAGYAFGRLGLKINDMFRQADHRARVLCLYSIFIHGWEKEWHTLPAYFQQTVEAGIVSGDLMFTAYAGSYVYYWDPQTDLETAIEESIRYLKIIEGIRYRNVWDLGLLLQQFRRNLCGQTKHGRTLDGPHFQEDACLKRLEDKQLFLEKAIFYLVKLQICCLREHYREAFDHIHQIESLTGFIEGMLHEVDFCFYGFLAYSQGFVYLDKADRKKARETMAANYRKMKKWARHCPPNFAFFQGVMEAETARRKNNNQLAGRCYDKAVALAHEQAAPRYEALACELAGKFYLAVGRVDVGTAYLREACLYYDRWGAKSKLEDLKQRYGTQFNGCRSEHQLSEILDDPDSLTGSFAFVDGTLTKPKKNGVMPVSEPLDIHAMAAVSQRISGEIDGQKVPDLMIRLALDISQADRGLLILEKNNDFALVAEGFRLERPNPCVNLLLAESEQLAKGVVYYVIRTHERIFLSNAAKEGLFTKNRYIQKHKIGLIVCAPLMHKKRFLGVLYLESKLPVNDFSSARLSNLDSFLAQAGIALENARLYSAARILNRALAKEVEDRKQAEIKIKRLNDQLESRVKERGIQLELTQKELVGKAHQAGMAQVAVSVLYNVGNILNSLITSSQMVKATLEKSKLKGLIAANRLLGRHMDDLKNFFIRNPKGNDLFKYYILLEKVRQKESADIEENVKRIIGMVYTIKNIILAQQSYATRDFQAETLALEDVLEEALLIQQQPLAAEDIVIERRFQPVGLIPLQKVKFIHVAINLLKNARDAMAGLPLERKKLLITTRRDEHYAYLTFKDSGSGIPSQNLGKIFSHGFTTKPDRQGFGLHGSANAMTEMGGTITAESSAIDEGAAFTLRLPFRPRATK